MCAENVLSFWCVFFCLDRFVYTCVCVLLNVIPGPYLYFIVVGISLNLEFANSARLTGQQAPGVLPSIPPQIYDYRHVSLNSAFPWMLWIWPAIPRDPPISPSPNLGLQTHVSEFSFSMGAQYLSSDLILLMQSTFPADSFFKPLSWYFFLEHAIKYPAQIKVLVAAQSYTE